MYIKEGMLFMIIYNSMIIWITVIGLLYNYRSSQNNNLIISHDNKRVVPLFFAIVTFGYIIFWAGIRTGYIDTSAYITAFISYPDKLSSIPSLWTIDNKSPGFITLGVIFKSLISTNYHAWLMMIALLTGLPIMWFLRKYSVNFFYSSFLFITTLNFTWMLNGIRQFLAAVIMLIFLNLIIEKKTIKFIIVVLLVSTIHFTVIIMIPLYFVAIEKPFGKRVVFLLFFIMMAVLFLNPFISSVENLLEGTNYSGYSSQFEFDDGVNPIRVLVMSITPILAFCSRKKLEEHNNSFINVCINMSVISASLYFIGIFTSGILVGRLPIYFELYNLVLLPYILKFGFDKNTSKILYCLCTIGFLAFYFVLMRGSYYISDLTGIVF